MTVQPDAATRLDTLDPTAAARLSRLHPVFADLSALPGEASLGEVAEAIGLPVTAILAAARNEIRVTVVEGQSCGCSCGGGSAKSGRED